MTSTNTMVKVSNPHVVPQTYITNGTRLLYVLDRDGDVVRAEDCKLDADAEETVILVKLTDDKWRTVAPKAA